MRTLPRMLLCMLWVGALALGGCARSRDVRVQMPALTLESQGAAMLAPEAGGDASMPFNVVVKNPYTKPMPLLSTAFAVNAEGRLIASGREDLRVKNVPPSVPPGTTQTIPVTARVTGRQLLDALAGGGGGGMLGPARGGETVPCETDVFVMVDSPEAGPVTISARAPGMLVIPAVMIADLQGVLFDPAGGPGDGWIGLALVNRCAMAVQVQSVACDVTLDRRIMASARLSLDQRLEPGARVELNLPMTIQPPLAADAKPAPGARLSYELRGTATGTSDRGTVTAVIEGAGKVQVAE